MKCVNCNFELEEEHDICPNCHTFTHTAVNNKTYRRNPPKRNFDMGDTKKDIKKETPVEEPIEETNDDSSMEDLPQKRDINDLGKIEIHDAKEDEVSEVTTEEVEIPKENNEEIELPKKEEVDLTSTELSDEDQFITNFVKKDDPLSTEKMGKMVEKKNTGLIASRIACIAAILVFCGVMYYSKVVLPKLNEQLDAANEIDYYDEPIGSIPNIEPTDSIGPQTVTAVFGDETLENQLVKDGIELTSDISNVDLTIDYGNQYNDSPFSIHLTRTNNGSEYTSKVSFEYNGATIPCISKTSTSNTKDLISNIINSYRIKVIGESVYMYSEASSFQLGDPLVVISFTKGSVHTIDTIVTTYSPDLSSITKCPIEIDETGLTYCKISETEFKKGELVTIYKVRETNDKNTTILEEISGYDSK